MVLETLITLLAGLLAGLATWILAYAALKSAIIAGALTRPGKHGHERPVPTGGGIVAVGAALLVWLFFSLITGAFAETWRVAAAAAALAALSFIDDLRQVPLLLRFAVHIAAVAFGLSLLPDTALLFGGALPLWADRLAVGVAWVWFTNLFNFMDGIDGIASVETIAVGGGLAVALLIIASEASGAGWAMAPLAAALAGAGAGFLAFNWQPARLFLGDAGSIPLGYLLGWLLVWSACVHGLWWLALALPLYYWVDATATLLARAARGEKVWLPHRLHAYQLATQTGASHATVARFVALIDAGLVLLVLLTAARLLPAWLMLILAATMALAAFWRLRHWPVEQGSGPAAGGNGA